MTKRKSYSSSGQNRRHSGGGGGRRYSNNNRGRSGGGHRGGHRREPTAILPSPSIIQEYEYASEGAAKKILHMAELEQKHRQEWEGNYIRSQMRSYRLGQLFGFLVAISIIACVVHLAAEGNDFLASVVAVAGFLSLALSSIFTGQLRRRGRSYARRGRSRRPRRDSNK